MNNQSRGYRSLFWPMLLIAVGILWLLGNLGVIATFDFGWLLRLWPLLLIALGLDLLFGRRSPLVGALIALLVVGVLVAVTAFGPALGLPKAAAVETRTLTASLDGINHATVKLNLSAYPTELNALKDSTNLFEGLVSYQGSLNYSAKANNGDMQIDLSHNSSVMSFDLALTSPTPRWTLGFSPQVPLDLVIDVASGSALMDLRTLKLASLNVEGGSGSSRMTLPTSATGYEASYDGASGSAEINLPADTRLTLRLKGGSGSIAVSLPANAAVRIQVNDNGSGSVNIPGSFTRLSGKSSEDKGEWESTGFSQAANKITIIVDDVSSGSFNFR